MTPSKSKRKRRGRGQARAAAGRQPAGGEPATAADSAAEAAPAAGAHRRTAVSVSVAAASGVLWFLACANFNIWPLAWIAMVPSLWVIERAPTRKRAALYGWVTGIVANAGGFYWVQSLLTRFAHLSLALGLLGVALLSAYQGVVFLLFALAARTIRDFSRERLGAPLPMVVVAPIVMVTFETLVPFIFPWYLAITQAWVPPVIQIAELTGPVGVTALLLMVGGAIYDVVTERGFRRRWLPALGAGGLLALSLVFGFARIHQVQAKRAAAPQLKVGLVQGNIPFDEKGLNHRDLAAGQLRDLQRESAKLQDQGAQLVVWSESSYPYWIPRQASHDAPIDNPTRIRRGFSVPLIFGALTYDIHHRDKPPYNTAVFLDGNRIAGKYDKIFLLMFGEYIPGLHTFPWLRNVLPSAAGNLSRGRKVTTFPFSLDGHTYRLGPLICYEDILPDLVRRVAALHPHLLVNITNDAWFGETSEPWEHLALSVFRAVETRTDLVRSVNTGVSAFVDATGRVYKKTYADDPKIHPRGVDGIVGQVALVEGGHTFFDRFGNLFAYACVVATALLWLVWPFWERRRAGRASS